MAAWLLLAVGAAIAQHGPADGLLNSERIAQRFGSYGIRVLVADGRLRVSNLYSEHGEEVTRTFAVVRFADEIPSTAADAHAEILAGGSIGAVFAGRGWTVTRRHLWFGAVPATDRVLEMMAYSGAARADLQLATHLFELRVARDDQPAIVYATIAEVHHPDYLALDDLRRLFAAPSAETLAEPGAAAASMLDRVRVAMQ